MLRSGIGLLVVVALVATATRPAPAATSPYLPAFVWPAVPGAHGYRIEFSRGTRVVLRVASNGPRLRVRRSQLPPGRYRWRVWRRNAGGAAVGKPVVDATLTIH